MHCSFLHRLQIGRVPVFVGELADVFLWTFGVCAWDGWVVLCVVDRRVSEGLSDAVV